MAPSPEHDNEPKAPDKNDNKNKNSVNKLGTDLLDLDPSNDIQESSVSTLDDGQLKALLDEAINYKCPKDREGKSKIFKVLLQEAEEDERNARAASASGPQLARYYNTSAARHRHRGGGNRNHPQSVSESLTHGGSLQNLAQPELFDPSPYLSSGGHCRRRNNSKKGTVSSRQREGGSLPSNVNSTGGRAFVSSFESQKSKMSIEMVPLNRNENNRIDNEKTSSASRCSGSGDYIIDISGHVDPDETKSLLDHDILGHNYETSASTYIQNESCVSQQEELPVLNRMRYTNTRTNIDTTISFPQLVSTASVDPQIIPFQLPESYNSVKSIVDGTNSNELKTEPLSITASLRSSSYRMTASNHVGVTGRQPLQQIDLSLGAKKTVDENGNAVSMDNNGKSKKKKPRADRKVTILNSEQVEGHRADIIHNIDKLVKYVESGDADANSTKRSSKHQPQQRRSTGRLNSKGNKSTENSGVKKSNSLEEISTSKLEDLVVGKGDRRSWGTEDGEQYYCKKLQQEPSVEVLHINMEATIEMSEFQVVNKKKKSRKRRNEPVSPQTQLSAPQNSTPARNRRKSSCSMPVSDKSDSSDLDSVHSLPVSAKLGNVSYANATTQVNIQNCEIKPTAPLLNSVEHFPELTKVISVIERRPPVIIPVSNRDNEVSGLTFGFEINEQLLALEPECENDSDIVAPVCPPLAVCPADSFTARYLPPVLLNNYNHDKIVTYVGLEWEKIMHQSNGKVRYYSGQ